MKIGEIEEEGERAIPGYTPPKPGALPPAPRREAPKETPAPTPVQPEKEKLPA